MSQNEKRYRYSVVRERMEKERLSALLIFSNAQIDQQGFVRYFTNLPIPIFSHALLFSLVGDPILLTPSPLQTFWAKEISWIPQGNIQLSKSFGVDIGGHLVELKLKNTKVGIASFRSMPVRDYKDLIRMCHNIELVDATEFLEDIRCVKSPEAIEQVKKSAAIAELAHKTFLMNLVPGIMEKELVAKVEEAVRSAGAERTFYLISGSQSSVFPYIPGDRKIKKGEPIIFSVELSGPDGYWSQMVRTFFWRKQKRIFERLYEKYEEIRLTICEELSPMHSVCELAENLKKLITKSGFETGVNFGHSLGLDVTEEPKITFESKRILSANQTITVHPHLISKEEGSNIWFGDMYLVNEYDTAILTPALSDRHDLFVE